MYHNKNSDNKNKAGKNVFIWTLVLVFMAAIAVGDIIENPAEAIAAELEAGGNEDFSGQGGPASEQTEEVSKEGMIKLLNFEKDATIRDGLRTLAALYKVNIVPSSKVDGQLNVTTLYNVTFDDAMAAILGGKYEYEQEGNLIAVFPKGDESRMKYAVFALQYISAAEAQKLIMPVLSGKGTVGVTTAAQTGVPVGESISAQTGGGDTMSLQDTLVVYDYAENIAEAKKVISSIDVRPKQVLVEATILSATLTEGMEMGVDLNLLAGVRLTGTEAVTGVQSSVGTGTAASSYLTDPVVKQNPLEQIGNLATGSAMETFGFANFGGKGLKVGITSGDVTAFITALETVTDTTILANPKILAVNKQLGQVYIGDKIGYESQTTVAESGTSTSKVEFLDTGTKLSFRPYIGANGYIRMDIHAKSSQEKGGEIISESSTELVSNIMVKDGQTVVIGGLFRDVAVTSRSQIPLLGDLPLIGVFFRSTKDSTQRQEVIVMLTPHIISEPSEANGDARAEDISRKRSGAKEGLQWISRARLAEDRYASAARYYIEGDNESALREVKTALELRPTYLEAIRLKEKIIGETDPNGVATIERNMLNLIEQEQASMWQRR